MVTTTGDITKSGNKYPFLSAAVQQRSCEEFVPDVQSKLKAVRMFLIAASWTAVCMVRLHASMTE